VLDQERDPCHGQKTQAKDQGDIQERTDVTIPGTGWILGFLEERPEAPGGLLLIQPGSAIATKSIARVRGISTDGTFH